MCACRRRGRAAHVQDHRGGGRAQRKHSSGPPAKQTVGLRQLGGQNHCIAGDPLVAVGVDRGDPLAGAFQRGDRRSVTEPNSGVGGGRRQRVGQCAHAAAGEEHARNGVHIGDHRVDRQGILRCDTGVERLEGEHPPQPWVADVALDHRVPAAESAERKQFRQPAVEQAQRRVEIGGDEAVEFGAVQPVEPVAQAPVAGLLLGAGEFAHRGGHPIGVGMDVDVAAVGEHRAVGGVHRQQFQPLGQVFTDGGESLVDEVRHGQHGRAGVDPVAVDVSPSRSSTRPCIPLHHRDSTAAAGQVQGGRKPCESRADHDDVIGAPRTRYACSCRTLGAQVGHIQQRHRNGCSIMLCFKAFRAC